MNFGGLLRSISFSFIIIFLRIPKAIQSFKKASGLHGHSCYLQAVTPILLCIKIMLRPISSIEEEW